ncbi:hypothetical protein [Sphingomonas elodea]|uniref:hypothetical protein n=1 Tax=Sphingomonas elodea TaxID=179878 RepID=UPI0018729840|nr:hypothetical protein [Sphingomonas elodea]
MPPLIGCDPGRMCPAHRSSKAQGAGQTDYRKLGFCLGLFSIGLGIAELAAVRAFGARELLAGSALLSGPAHSVRVWNRVAGYALDIAALGLATRRAPQNKAVRGGIAFVAAATALDIVTSLGRKRGIREDAAGGGGQGHVGRAGWCAVHHAGGGVTFLPLSPAGGD